MTYFRITRRTIRWLLVSGVAALAYAGLVVSQTSPPAIPAVNLSSEPLYAKGTRDKPTLTLALSVEFPTVGAQYVSTPGATEDASYNPDEEYIGYFDADSCYAYVNDTSPTRRRFDRLGPTATLVPAAKHRCAGAGFSGNFMNWATSSAVDVLRLGLTGGDRIVDESNMTVLQRAVLPQGRFWNDSNFPSKKLLAAHANDAVPTTLRKSGLGAPASGDGYAGDIYVANCLNRVHFGTSVTGGSCGTPGSNSNLGTPDGTHLPSTGVYSGTLPADFTYFASEHYSGSSWGPAHAKTGTKQIAYGTGTTWALITVTNSTVYCSNAWWSTQSVPGLAASGDPTPGTGKQCRERTPPATSASTALTSDYFFYSRVKVCESDSDKKLLDPRTTLCQRYPNGYHKPVGNLQIYSDRMRVAAFGYLMDNVQSRYGGVLRAPMKYVGPKRYDGSGELMAGANPNIEWDTNTGVYLSNPQAAGEGKSGVINYLNQFGRLGTTEGTYKTYDPVGELYYESLRYLQGLPPTAKATEGMTVAMKDGFPVYAAETEWTDPHAGGSKDKSYSCQKNNIFVIGDINTHNDKSIPGNTTRLDDDESSRTASVANNEPDFHHWTSVVGAFEGRTNLHTANTGATKASYYMAGMAYWALTNDIRGTAWTAAPEKQRPGMRVKTYVLDVNEYGSSSTASTRHNSAFFLTAKYGGFDTTNAESGTHPLKNTKGVADATVWAKPGTSPGEAKTFFLASNAKAVLESLNEIFATVAAEGNSIAGGAISTQRLTSVGGYIYQAQFDPADWSGDVVAYTVAVDADKAVTVGTDATAAWKASARLDSAIAADRNIFVGKVTADSGGTATSFTWSGIEESLKTALNKPSPSGTADGQGEKRLDFLRGDRSLEGTTFRKRGSRLGDIINSGIVYSGAPSRSVSSDAFRSHYTAYKDRVPALFVGANDGMLHALNANTGDELFAYIPSWVGKNLSLLTHTAYAGAHTSYVDGSPAVAEALVETSTGPRVKTVLVGGTGAGGQGVYALDVTNPSDFNASKVMWEFTDRDDPDMGNVVGRPQILRMRITAPGASATYKWYAVVGSGVNNYVNDGRYSSSGAPALFLFDLSKGQTDAWALGTNYFKIVLPFDAALGAAAPTGVVNFRATGGPNGEVENIYAGDLHGRMWKLDFAKLGRGDWNTAKLSPFADATGQPLPMFIARNATGSGAAAVQPISMEPTALYGPEGSTLLAFGTGKYLESADNLVSSSTPVQSVYALLDTGKSTLDSAASGATAAISGRARLMEGTRTGTTVTVPAFKWGRAMSDGDTSQRSGWYFDLPAGERLVSTFATFGNSVIFGSVIPPDGMGSGACGSGGGNQYIINIGNGSGTVEVSTIGVLGQPFVFPVGSAAVTVSDSLGRRKRTETGQIILQGSTGLKVVTATKPVTTDIIGRLSWRQIPNYHELKSK